MLPLKNLETCFQKFDADALAMKRKWLDAFTWKFPSKPGSAWAKTVLRLYDILLFMKAHPANAAELRKVNEVLKVISEGLYKSMKKHPLIWQASGLPFTSMQAAFSHEALQWLASRKDVELSLESYDESGQVLNTVLKSSLVSTEKSEADQEYSNADLLYYLGLKQKDTLEFILHQYEKLNALPYVKDKLWADLQLYVNIRGKHASYSKHENGISSRPFFHNEILRKFDHALLMRTPLPEPLSMDDASKNKLIGVIKSAMSLTMRETDPATYLEPDSLRYYELERGISVALFGIPEGRQMPLESYVGYTLFKNGIPAAYGGSWIFGRSAEFGLNVFDSFRGGESGYILCQLLRVYKMVFGLYEIEVDAYQFGRDNEDGIQSGAFWFYYRYGFRPMQAALRNLAYSEIKKIQSTPGYRCKRETLLRFTESNVSIRFEEESCLRTNTCLSEIKKWMKQVHQGHRMHAEKAAIHKLKQWFPDTASDLMQHEAWIELMFLCLACNIPNKQAPLLEKLIKAKARTPYAYNDLLCFFLPKDKS